MNLEDPASRPLAVIDASVSLKWALNDEEAVDEALALRDASLSGHLSLVAPPLWYYQVVNGMVAAVRRGRLDARAGTRALMLMLRLGVHLADPPASTVYEVALRYDLAAYDAAYLALSEELSAPVWTGDRRLYEKLAASEGAVRWIGDYE